MIQCCIYKDMQKTRFILPTELPCQPHIKTIALSFCMDKPSNTHIFSLKKI